MCVHGPRGTFIYGVRYVPMSEAKDILRQEALRHRVLRDPRDEEPDLATDIFLKNIELPEGAIISGYWPQDKEFDPHGIMEALQRRGHMLSLPVVEKDTRVLKFARWEEGDNVEEGGYKIPQPVNKDWVKPDALIVPMLAFDRRGNRLGMGGGYYDATLAHLRSTKEILAVGVAFASQACLFSLPEEEHDQKLDWVITPKEAHDFRMYNPNDK